MPRRRTVLAAAGAMALIGTPAYAATTVKSIVDSKAGPHLAIGAFRGREQYAVNGNQIHQIGSITKTFTSLALAITRRLDEPYPAFDGVRLHHLASHTSGLDRLPPGLLNDPDLDLKDPYANFTKAKLAKAIRETKLLTPPGTAYLYSNYGAGLLGDHLAGDYAAMIRHLIAEPLGLNDTRITLNGEQKRRKVQGHDATGADTPDWHMATMKGAGALYGTVNDLLCYLRAHLGQAPAHLRDALKLVQQPRFTVNDNAKVCLGWHTIEKLPTSGRKAIWHDGGTGGFASFAAFCPSANTGVVVLSNKADYDRPSLLGIEILDALQQR